MVQFGINCIKTAPSGQFYRCKIFYLVKQPLRDRVPGQPEINALSRIVAQGTVSTPTHSVPYAGPAPHGRHTPDVPWPSSRVTLPPSRPVRSSLSISRPPRPARPTRPWERPYRHVIEDGLDVACMTRGRNRFVTPLDTNAAYTMEARHGRPLFLVKIVGGEITLLE